MRQSILFVTSFVAAFAAGKDITYDCEQTPEICLNTCWAIKCMKFPAVLDGGNQKDAAASAKYGDTNRRAWGYGSKPCEKHDWAWTTPSGQAATSPDEYPYASSASGGLQTSYGYVQLRCVPSTEQSKQGAKVKGIGTSSDKWQTKWDNISKLSQDWCGPNPTCQNDGHQFTSTGKNGPFSEVPNPKKVRDIASYSEDGNSAWVTMRGDEPVDPEEEEGVEEKRDASNSVGVPFQA